MRLQFIIAILNLVTALTVMADHHWPFETGPSAAHSASSGVRPSIIIVREIS